MTEHRKDSLARLLEAAAEMGCHGPAAVARALVASDQSVNNWKSRGVPHSMAIKAQELWGVSAHWIETNDGPKWIKVQPSSAASAPYEAPSASGDAPDLVITQYDTGGAMGHGFNLADNAPGQIKSWRVDHDWLRLNVPVHTGVKNLAIVTGFGPSMRPMFNPGDPLLVDTGVNVVDHEGVYFFRVGDEGFIKMIQRIPDPEGAGVMLQIISKNPDYPPYPMSPKNPHFQVLGKVLTVWRSEQY
jgi:phage repressor protein C with HTH and peptisase S24 domain